MAGGRGRRGRGGGGGGSRRVIGVNRCRARPLSPEHPAANRPMGEHHHHSHPARLTAGTGPPVRRVEPAAVRYRRGCNELTPSAPPPRTASSRILPATGEPLALDSLRPAAGGVVAVPAPQPVQPRAVSGTATVSNCAPQQRRYTMLGLGSVPADGRGLPDAQRRHPAVVGIPAGLRTPPVMFFIHGGGLHHGQPATLPGDGAALARRGCVYVSVNYRPGALGCSTFRRCRRRNSSRQQPVPRDLLIALGLGARQHRASAVIPATSPSSVRAQRTLSRRCSPCWRPMAFSGRPFWRVRVRW